MTEKLEQKTFPGEAPAIVNASDSHMACLFLLDTSGSMAGEPLRELVSGLNRFKAEVCEERSVLSILDVAVVEFNTAPRVVQDFVPVQYMDPVQLEAQGGTSMTAALRLAIDMTLERGRFYLRTGAQPYCPWIVMITDGQPTDSIDAIKKELLDLDEQKKLHLWALAVEGANVKLLSELCHGKRVLTLKGYDFTGFFDWLNMSMRSISASSPGERAQGQALPANVDKVIDNDWM